MTDLTHSFGKRGLLVCGAVSLWVLGLMWMLHGKATDASSGSGAEHALVVGGGEAANPATDPAEVAESADELGPELVEVPPAPTHWVRFESEPAVGVCTITYEGRTKIADLHVSVRLPEGEVDFAYQCGDYHGRGSIDVKARRLNGVLLCKETGRVRIQRIRHKDDRCTSPGDEG